MFAVLTGEIAGVVGEDFVVEAGAVDVEVDFGGSNAFVSEHLLDGSERSSTFEKVGGE